MGSIVDEAVWGKILDGLEKKAKQHQAELEGINHALQVHRRLIDELSPMNQHLSDSKLFKIDIEKKFSSILSAQARIEEHLEVFKNQIDKFRRDVSVCETKIHELIARFESHQSVFCHNQNLTTAQLREERNYVNDFIQNSKIELKALLDNMRKELAVNPATIFEQNDVMMKKLETAMLDGSNAMLKQNNTDVNLKLLERKLENLSLLVKKLDLALQVK